MAGTQDEDMYLFQGGLDQTPDAFAGQDFDNFLTASPGNQLDGSSTGGFMNPNDLTIKREQNDSGFHLTSGLPRSSRSSASSSSSSASANYATRNISNTTTVSPATSANHQSWGSGINGMTISSAEQYFDDAAMTGLGDDLDASNQQMASAFDFETAASTPSGYDAASMATIKASAAQPFRRTTNMTNFAQNKTTSPRLPVGGQAQFYLGGSREASPLSAMLPQTQAPSPWTKHSPSSGLEETFNHITMNGDSPGNATFSPNMQFSSNNFAFDPDSSGTPSTYNKDISSPPSTIHSGDGSTHLTIYPTSLKSRVETQIPIKMILYPLPPGVKKLRLPTHTVSKPKFLAKPEVERGSEILELYTSLVCTSAMQDPLRLERALARARGEELSAYSRPSPASSNGSHTSSKDDEEKPLNGGEVRICSGCIQRERKRASRKKQKKPEEEELFQKDEEKRVVVFNTSEIKDWVEVTKENQPAGENMPPPPPGAMQVELPMRIACYCRHQNEKMGFQVIFTIKDCREKVVAQALTNSIMITDDHKTHNAPTPIQNPQVPQMPTGPQLPGAGVFSTSGVDMQNSPLSNTKLFKQSFSTTDLHNLQHNFNPHFPMTPVSNPFALSGPMSAVSSGTMTPRNLSRPASPSGPGGPHTKRRKQSGSGKLPSGLTMTRLDTTPNAPAGPATMPNTAASSPYATSMSSFMSPGDRYSMAAARHPPYGTSPPTPNGSEAVFAANINRTFSLENIPRQAMISAPPSRQPSRPSSPRPSSNRNSFGATDAGFGQAVNNGLMNQPSRRPLPIIHKLVPAEGSVTGGTEVTLLGNGFYQGLEVMFGDTEATTTTFWGEKCLNCIAPPALQPGVVAVMFKHEHPQYSTMQQQSQPRHSVFTYVDDREVEMLRLALRTIGKQMQHPTDDPYSAAQQLIQQNQAQGMWPQQGNYGVSGGHQRHPSQMQMSASGMLRFESSMLSALLYAQGLAGHVPIDLSFRRQTGLTLLHIASSLGMTRLVADLLTAGANPNVLDRCGHSPMHHAAMRGHDQIIHRLRVFGGNHQIRSVRGFTPSDLATTLLAYQATLRSLHHRRSRSAGSRTHGTEHSLVSLDSFWDCDSDDYDSSGSETIDEEGNSLTTASALDDLKRRIVFAQSAISTSSSPTSRRGSMQTINRPESSQTSSIQSGQSDPPSTLMQAWRQLLNATHIQQQQLADQIQHFQDIAQSTLPQLPSLPQDNAVVRRMSNLFSSSPISGAPPAYNELFPVVSNPSSDVMIKKSSAAQLVTDATADLSLDIKDNKHSFTTRDGTCVSRDSLNYRTELVKDRKLMFFWIPILAIVLGLLTRSSGIVDALPRIYQGVLDNMHRGKEVVEVS